MASTAEMLPQELLVCVFIHGFVLPIPRWVRSAAADTSSHTAAKRSPYSSPSSLLSPHIAASLAPNYPPLIPITRPASTPVSLAFDSLPSNDIVSTVPTTDAHQKRFKGTDGTFCGFPDRLKHVLSEIHPNAKVECVVFPAYETRGELAEAVARFVDWLTTLTVTLESQHGRGAGSAKIILCGHSMGGLVAADALLGIASGRPKGTKEQERGPLWPRIVACIGFDTPYLGLHPNVFKQQVNQVSSYLDAAKTLASGMGIFGLSSSSSTPTSPSPAEAPKLMPPSSSSSPRSSSPASGWASLVTNKYYAAAAGTLLAAGAAAGTAYYRRQDLVGGWQWASDHLRYVGNLWDEKSMRERLEGVLMEGVVFRNFYTLIPNLPFSSESSPRTFSIIPASNSPFARFFLPQKNGLAKDEIEAHVGMFEPKSNDGYYEMGLEVVKAVGEAIKADKGMPSGSAAAEASKANVQANVEASKSAGAPSSSSKPPDLIDLNTPLPRDLPLSSASTSTLPPSAMGSASSSQFPPTPSTYPTSSAPISAVPSSAQISPAPWSAASFSDGPEKAGISDLSGMWATVPVTPMVDEPEPAGARETIEEEGQPQPEEMDNPWLGRLRRKDRKP